MAGEGGNIRFQIRRGNMRVLLTFAPAYGAVIKSRVEDADGMAAETEYRYAPISGGFVLAEERSTVRMRNSSLPLSIVRKYSGLSIK